MVRNVLSSAPHTMTAARISLEQTSTRSRLPVVCTPPTLARPPNSRHDSNSSEVRTHPIAQRTEDSQEPLKSEPAPTSARSGSPAAVTSDAAGPAPILRGSLIGTATGQREPDSLPRSGQHDPVASAKTVHRTVVAPSSAHSCLAMTAAPRPLTTNSDSLDNGEVTGRLQLVVTLGDKRVAVVALESDWKRITEFTGVEAEKAVEWTVVQGLRTVVQGKVLRNEAAQGSGLPVCWCRRCQHRWHWTGWPCRLRSQPTCGRGVRSPWLRLG